VIVIANKGKLLCVHVGSYGPEPHNPTHSVVGKLEHVQNRIKYMKKRGFTVLSPTVLFRPRPKLTRKIVSERGYKLVLEWYRLFLDTLGIQNCRIKLECHIGEIRTNISYNTSKQQ
jgi:hypothetical protein